MYQLKSDVSLRSNKHDRGSLDYNSQMNFMSLLIENEKNYQTFPPGTLNMFSSLWIITELAHIKIFAQEVLQLGSAAVIFLKNGRTQNSTPF